MKELTLKDAVRLHRELWTWLAETGTQKKRMWPRWNEIEDEYETDILFDCFACECADGYCSMCSFVWPAPHDVDRPCGADGREGLYTNWCDADEEERKALARQIAALPLKPEYQKMLEEEETDV